MRRFSEIENEFMDQRPQRVDAIEKFYAYKSGSFEVFDDKREALKFSSLVEKVIINKAELDDFNKSNKEYRNKIHTAWKAELRDEFREFNDKTFNYMYEKVTSEESNYDQITNSMFDLADFVSDILKANENK